MTKKGQCHKMWHQPFKKSAYMSGLCYLINSTDPFFSYDSLGRDLVR